MNTTTNELKEENQISHLLNTEDPNFPWVHEVPDNDFQKLNLLSEYQVDKLDLMTSRVVEHIPQLIHDFFGERNEFMKQHIFIAGGCISSIYHNETPHDIDIYIENFAIEERDLYYFMRSDALTNFRSNVGDCHDFSVHGRVISFTTCYPTMVGFGSMFGTMKYQIIFCNRNLSYNAIRWEFDYSHTKAVYFPYIKKLNVPELTARCITNKYLMFSGDMKIHTSLQRLVKLMSNGWTTSNFKTLIKNICMNLLDTLLNDEDSIDFSCRKDSEDLPCINSSSPLFVQLVLELQHASMGRINLPLLLKYERKYFSPGFRYNWI